MAKPKSRQLPPTNFGDVVKKQGLPCFFFACGFGITIAGKYSRAGSLLHPPTAKRQNQPLTPQ
jgi:hypothetical protein